MCCTFSQAMIQLYVEEVCAHSRQAHDVEMTSHWRQCNVTTYQRQFNVITTSCACWVYCVRRPVLTVISALLFFSSYVVSSFQAWCKLINRGWYTFSFALQYRQISLKPHRLGGFVWEACERLTQNYHPSTPLSRTAYNMSVWLLLDKTIKECLSHIFYGYISKYFNKVSLGHILYFHNWRYKFEKMHDFSINMQWIKCKIPSKNNDFDQVCNVTLCRIFSYLRILSRRHSVLGSKEERKWLITLLSNEWISFIWSLPKCKLHCVIGKVFMNPPPPGGKVSWTP